MNRKTFIIIILPLLLVTFVASGCTMGRASLTPLEATETPTPTLQSGALHEGVPLTWEKIADGSGAGEEFLTYAGHVPRLIVITEPDAVSTLHGKVSSTHLTQIAETDFSSHFVAVIHRGTETLIEWPQGIETMREYQPIEVESVRLNENIITVYAKLHRQVFDERYVFNPAISPYYVLRIGRPAGMKEKEVDFVLNADGQTIPQMCAMKGERLRWEKMVLDSGVDQTWAYKERSPQLVIIAEQEAISSVQSQLPPQHLALVANVDYSTHFVAIVYRGKGGITNRVVEMIDVKQRDGTIVICAQLHEPHPRQPVAAMVGSPYYIMKVEKSEGFKGEFTFVLMDNGEEVVRQTKVIP